MSQFGREPHSSVSRYTFRWSVLSGYCKHCTSLMLPGIFRSFESFECICCWKLWRMLIGMKCIPSLGNCIGSPLGFLEWKVGWFLQLNGHGKWTHRSCQLWCSMWICTKFRTRSPWRRHFERWILRKMFFAWSKWSFLTKWQIRL